jgi:hypothetical protein
MPDQVASGSVAALAAALLGLLPEDRARLAVSRCGDVEL